MNTDSHCAKCGKPIFFHGDSWYHTFGDDIFNCGVAVKAEPEYELCECGQPNNSIRHSFTTANSVDAHEFKPKIKT